MHIDTFLKTSTRTYLSTYVRTYLVTYVRKYIGTIHFSALRVRGKIIVILKCLLSNFNKTFEMTGFYIIGMSTAKRLISLSS